MLKKINILGEKNKYSFYLAFFRLFVCFHLLKDIILGWDGIGLLYKADSFMPTTPSFYLQILGIDKFINTYAEIFFMVFILILILHFFGIGKSFTAFLVFLLLEIQQQMCYFILNGGDNILRFVIFYMVFANSYEFFSIKPLRLKNPILKYCSTFLTNIAGLSIKFHLCWAYFISAIHKIHADVWFKGVATYYIFQIERFKGTPYNEMLVKNGYFVAFSTYFTLLVELLYPTLVWFKETKKYIVVAMISLHLGIYVFMMIYDFQIIFIMLQGFFFSNYQWITFINKIKRRVYRSKSKKQLY